MAAFMKRRLSVATPLMLLLLWLIAPSGNGVERGGRTNGALVEGEADRLSVADDKMNAAYQKLLGVLDADGKAALREAQRKWLAWRDAQAEFDAHQLKGGKLWQMELDGSRAGTTERRTIQLQEDCKRFGEG